VIRWEFQQSEEDDVQPAYGPFHQPPVCLALVLARSVSYSQETGLWSIVGPYATLTLGHFPFRFVSMEAYAVLTECDGDVLVELGLVDVNEVRPPVFRQLISASFDGPQDVQEIIYHNYNVSVPAEDEYRLLLRVYRPDFTHPEFVLERRLLITQG
jgi:hypothetical protein